MRAATLDRHDERHVSSFTTLGERVWRREGHAEPRNVDASTLGGHAERLDSRALPLVVCAERPDMSFGRHSSRVARQIVSSETRDVRAERRAVSAVSPLLPNKLGSIENSSPRTKESYAGVLFGGRM